MLFSVLIPVYNAEKYLRDCLDSVLNQTEKDFEIIIIDDGSNDHSAEICDQYQTDFVNLIRVRHTKNSGQISARNFLIELARGDYLVHLDADDYLRPDALARLKETIEEHNADLIIYGIHRIGVDGKETDQLLANGKTVYEGDGKSEIYKTMCRRDILNNYVTKIASRELVLACDKYEHLPQVMIGEDLLQSLPLVTKARKIVYLGEALYCYRKNSTSMTATSGPKRYKSEFVVYRELLRYSKLWGVADEVHEDILKRYASMCIDTLIVSSRYGENPKDFFDEISKDPLFQDSSMVFGEFPLWKRLLGIAALKGYYRTFNAIQNMVHKLSKMRRHR